MDHFPFTWYYGYVNKYVSCYTGSIMKKYIVALLLIQAVQLLNAAADEEDTPVNPHQLLGEAVAHSIHFFAPASYLGEPYVRKLLLGDRFPVHNAVEQGSLFRLAYFVSRGFDLEERDNMAWRTPLHKASWWLFDRDVLLFLLKKGADVNARNYFGHTPIFEVIMQGNPGGAQLLLEHGADLNARDNSGRTPFFHARNVPTFRWLLENGADVNVRDDHDCTPLFGAIERLRGRDCVEFLLQNGAGVNVRDTSGNTPLGFAISTYGRARLDSEPLYSIVQLLVESDADVNAQDNNGCTPLHKAASVGNLPCVKLLLKQKNINIYLTDADQKSPAHYALRGIRDWNKDDYLQILQALAQEGAPLSDASYQNDFDPLIEDGIITQEEWTDIMSWVVEDVKMAQD